MRKTFPINSTEWLRVYIKMYIKKYRANRKKFAR